MTTNCTKLKNNIRQINTFFEVSLTMHGYTKLVIQYEILFLTQSESTLQLGLNY